MALYAMSLIAVGVVIGVGIVISLSSKAIQEKFDEYFINPKGE